MHLEVRLSSTWAFNLFIKVEKIVKSTYRKLAAHEDPGIPWEMSSFSIDGYQVIHCMYQMRAGSAYVGHEDPERIRIAFMRLSDRHAFHPRFGGASLNAQEHLRYGRSRGSSRSSATWFRWRKRHLPRWSAKIFIRDCSIQSSDIRISLNPPSFSAELVPPILRRVS